VGAYRRECSRAVLVGSLSVSGIERWFGVGSFFGPGIVVAVVLVAALAVVLPRAQRGRVAAPLVLIGLHVLLELVVLLLPKGAFLSRTLEVLGVFLLALALGRSAFLLVVDGVLSARLGRSIPRIFRDVIQSCVYLAAGLVALRFAGVEPGSILTTSALLTAVIGLSLQDTLGNLFAGISIQMQRPFEVGDFVQFDPDTKLIGRVIEINWRATTLVTNDEMEVIVPNAALAKAPIRNYTKPSPVARRTVHVSCSYEVPPERVRSVLLAALVETPDVLSEPGPSVITAAFGASGIDYQVRYFTRAFESRDVTDSAVRERIWYALRRAEISIPFPRSDVHLHEVSAERDTHRSEQKRGEVEQRLREVDFLAVLPQEALARLAERAPTKVYAPGEIMIRQAAPGDAMYLILRGEVSVLVGRPGSSTAEVARLRAGSLFGEMSLMTGEPRAASVQAMTETEVLVVEKDIFAEIVATDADAIERMTRILAERQDQLESHLAARAAKSDALAIEERTNALLGRVRDFFKMR
jgi:small-conductance mechanosensitive channel/CRP-like cAMP-binding protein